MAARIPTQVPAMFARRQPRVIHLTKRMQSSSASQTQNPAYPLYPSVAQLLHKKGVPESEVSKIPASGPKGRLLKGDVLAYLGQIATEYPATQAANLAKLTTLDLSNIKIAAPKPAEAEAPTPAPAKEAPIAKPLPTTSVAISISLEAVLRAQRKLQKHMGITIPVSRFLAVATDLANDALPRSKNEKASADELFDEVLGGERVTVSRGDYIPELNAFEAQSQYQTQTQTQTRGREVEDIIDVLSAKPGKRASAASIVEDFDEDFGGASNVFSLTVPVDEKVRAKAFLERIKTLLQVEPARLVL